MKDLTVSILQADLYWEEINANLAMFEEMIWSAAPSELILLPEMFTTGFSMNPEKLAEPPGGKTFKWMRQAARQHDAAIAGSYIVKDKGRFYNRLYFVKPDGSAQFYDKKHLFNLAKEGECYTAGTNRLILTFKGWRIHPLICYDLRFPVWSRSQRTKVADFEYDLLFYVANWPEARINAWDSLLKARAIENQSYVLGVNRVGVDGTKKQYCGHSGAYSASGHQLGFAASQKEVLTFTLSADELLTYREKFPFQSDADGFHLIANHSRDIIS